MSSDGRPFRVSHVLLDVDGTLVDYGSAIRAAFTAAAERASTLVGETVTPDLVYRLRDAVTHDPEWRSATITAQRRESVRRLLVAYGADGDEEIGSVVDAYEEARDRALTVFPDVMQSLEGVSALGITMIAASNGNVDLGRVGIGHLITGTHYASDIGVSKPDPRFFALALERLGIAGDRALVVGDRLDNDYTPARAGGLHAVLLDRGGTVVDEAVRRIASLTELPALLERA